MLACFVAEGTVASYTGAYKKIIVKIFHINNSILSQNNTSFPHIFGRLARENNIEHRLTKPYHPWTNGQAERMVRTIKEATVKSFHYASINELLRHVRDWLSAYNFAKQLKALKFKTPYETVQELWKTKPDVFIVKPDHHMLGLNKQKGGRCAGSAGGYPAKAHRLAARSVGGVG